jgi:hypothetical protein
MSTKNPKATKQTVMVNLRGKMTQMPKLTMPTELVAKFPEFARLVAENAVPMRPDSSDIFSYSNSKMKSLQNRLSLSEKVIVASWDIIAGYTCPWASVCLCYAKRTANKTKLVKKGRVTCYAAKLECVFPNTLNLHLNNLISSLRADFIERADEELKRKKTAIVRIHSAGELYNFEYFQKIYKLAQLNPQTQFFGYTKGASFVQWLNNHELDNLHLIYSHGGKLDRYAETHTLQTAFIVLPAEDGLYKLAVENDNEENISPLYRYDDKEEKLYRVSTSVWTNAPEILPIACQSVESDDYEYICQKISFGLMLH